MSDKPVNPKENNSENKELTPAEKIHQKINELKNGAQNNTDTENNNISSPENKTETENEDILKETPEKVEEIKDASEKEPEIKDEISNTEDNTVSSGNSQSKEESKEDFFAYTKEQLTEKINNLLSGEYNPSLDTVVKKIKEAFYKIVNDETETQKAKFIEEGGKTEDFEPVKDEIQAKFKELLQKFADKKETFEIKLNEQKKKNLALKYDLIEEIKELVNKPESFSKIFNRFKNLQKKWSETGPVPKNELKALLDEYNKHVQKFYEYVDVNKQLRELDFKKNFEIKTSLCEKAEELLLETDYKRAKSKLQELHKKWKETGAVANEVREELWARFQAATIQINEKFTEYLSEIKKQQEKNLESKQFLVEKAEELANKDYDTHIEWKNASDKVIELQRLWKRIGYVPKEYNNKIYSQFKSACDLFFERIRKYYEETEKDREDNYQKKLDLCAQAESLQYSDEWVKTAEIYKTIQNEWKKIGPVPKKYSDEIWKRFRKACNTFFDRKKEYYKNRKATEKENLRKKQDIIERIENFEFSEDQTENLKRLKELQNEFISIGYVPFEHKDAIYERFHNAVNSQFEKLNISKEKIEELRFAENIEALKKSPDSDFLIQKEMIKLQKQIEKLNDDIKVWENNIGFFSSSSKSDSLIKNITDKIEKAKSKVSFLRKKLNELEKTQE